MGIRHLQSYICRDVPNGHLPVDIKEEVDNWKRNNQKSNQQPIIVIDVTSMIPASLFPDLGVTLCGGRHQNLVEKCCEFFNRLINLGVKLVFFTDGTVQKAKYSTWFKRQDRRHRNMMNILDDVYENLNTSDLVQKYRNDIPDSVNMPPLKVACKRSGEFHKSFNVECDLEIAKYATKNKVLAVIADDTDFLIFEGDWKYWSSKDLNYSSLTTMEYNKIALRENLGLNVRQMPLFATVGGNDIVQYELVEGFHKAHCGRPKFKGIARYVKFIRNYPAHMNNDIISQISFDLFGKTDQEHTDLIVQSLESYNIRSRPADPLQDELLSRTFNELHAFIYEVLTNIPSSFTIVFYDFRKSDFKNYYELIERLILRPMGVLLKHKNDPSLKRTILTKKSQDQGYGEFEVTPEYPEIEVPSLMELLFEKNNETLIPIRFELLAWIISDKIQAKTLQEIPIIYLPDILVVLYLLENKQISLIEADSVLRTINDVQNNLVPIDISSPSEIDERAMRFSFLFVKVFLAIKSCSSAVGLNKMETKFDALYYQIIYKKYKIIPDEERESIMEDLNDLRSYCLAAL